jgi:iron complex outermembrane recepter protein
LSKIKRAQQAQSVSATIIRRTAIAQAITFAFMAGTVQAQTAPTTPAADAQKIDTVTVTGIRKGIEDAINIKRNSDSIVEAISAEDIGKLPDISVAESLARLPGVTAQRNRGTGKAQNLSVRGMSPDFSGALLNGREQASTGDSRGVEFDQFPSELVTSVLVYKTPDGALIGQGLASTIDQKTARPLAFGGRSVTVAVRGLKSGVGVEGAETGTGDRASLSYIDQFAGRTIGVAVGLTRQKEKGAEQLKFNSWGGWLADVDYNGGKVKVPGGFTADTEQVAYNRDGFMGVLQFKPNKNFETVLDIFYSKGSSSSKKTGLEGAVGGLSAGDYDPRGVLTNATIVNGFATSGTIDKYKGVVRNHIESADDSLKAIGLNVNYKVAPGWVLEGDLHRSKVLKTSSRYETTAGQAGNATNLDTISWTGFNGTNFTDVQYKPGLNYADRSVVSLTDVMGWSGGAASPQAGYLAQPRVEDTVDGLRLGVTRDLDVWHFTKVDFGINRTDRSKNRTTQEGRLEIIGSNPFGTASVPGAGSTVAGTTGIQVVSFDPRGSLGSIYQLASKVDADILNKSWVVDEKITTLFAKGSLSGALGSFNYRGNVGLQYINTDQSSSGNSVDRVTCVGNTAARCPSTVLTGGTKFNDVLPSINLAFDVAPTSLVRFGMGKVMARPNMGDMRASFDVNWDANKGFIDPATGNIKLDPITGKPTGLYIGSSGTPDLKPFRAKAFDISYEHYFGKSGYISAAAFYKDMDSYIVKIGTPYDFKQSVAPVAGRSSMGILSRPFNGEGGTIHGIELAVNVPMNLFAKALDGFGVSLNHSDTSSSLVLPTSAFSTDGVGTVTIPLPGLSKKVTNLRLYYEKYGFQAAVASRTRSDFLGEISDFQDNRQYTFIKGETVVDLQFAYQFASGPIKGLSLYLQANNFNKAKFQRYADDPATITETINPGRVYILGGSYKF